MYKKIGLIILLMSFVILPTILAVDTNFIIQTKPGKDVSLKLLHDYGKNEGRVLDSSASFYSGTDQYGFVNFTYSSNSTESPIQISINILPDMGVTQYFRFIPIGKNIFINLTEKTPQPIITDIPKDSPNVTISVAEVIPTPTPSPKSNSTNSTNSTQSLISAPKETETVKESEKISLNSNAVNSSTNFNYWPYITIGSLAFLFVILLFFLITVQKSRQVPGQTSNIKTVKFSEKYGSGSDYAKSKDLALAEKKLNEARDEINKIKQRDVAIKEAESKLREDQERLRRLRGF